MSANETEAQVETVVMVATYYGASKTIQPDWKPWPGRELEDVVAEVTEKVRDSHRRMEVIEVAVRRRIAINPIVEAVDVTELTTPLPAAAVESTQASAPESESK